MDKHTPHNSNWAAGEGKPLHAPVGTGKVWLRSGHQETVEEMSGFLS